MNYVSLAARNLRRHKRRTVLSSAAIVLGVFYLIMGRALIGGIKEGIVRSAIDGLSGEVLIRAKDYPTRGLQHPVDALPELTPAARAKLDDGARAWVGRTMFVATASHGRDSMRIRGIGFDPSADEAVFGRSTWQVQGKVPASAKDGVLLGNRLAELLGLEVGSSLVLQSRTHLGAINALTVPVAGIVATGNSAIDGSSAYMVEELSRDLVRNPTPTHYYARLRDRDDAPAFARELAAAAGADVEVVDWVTDTADLLRLQNLRQNALNILVTVLMAIAAMAIANTILMAAHERVGEIGTLRAMGMSRRGVLALFLLEGGLMGLGAGVLGAVAGGWLAHSLATDPIDLARLGAAQAVGGNLQFSTWLYAEFTPAIVIVPTFVAIAVAVLASVGPARIASGIEPADAVRGR